MLRYKTETRPGLVALYDIRPGNGVGQFLQPRSPHGAHRSEGLMKYSTCTQQASDTLVGSKQSSTSSSVNYLRLKILHNHFTSFENCVGFSTHDHRQALIFCQAHLYAHSCTKV